MANDSTREGLTPGELALVADAEVDDVSFVWALIDLGIRANPPETPDWRPTMADIDAAFLSIETLVDRGLLRVGRLEYIDDGPPGRVAPVRHVAEPLDLARLRVEEAVATAHQPDDWENACWMTAG